jgi:calcineurin-like phosphoesterase family protein
MTSHASPEGQKLRFLHISDLHFDHHDADNHDPFADIRNELERDLQNLIPQVGALDAILVGGDIAYRASEIEYNRAGEWFDYLCQQLNIEEDRLFMVPGNHDVNRQMCDTFASIKDAHHALRTCLSEDIDERLRGYFRDPEEKNRLFKPIAEYNKFSRRYVSNFDADRSKWETAFPLSSEINLIIRGINSTLISDRHDDDQSEVKKLVVGKAQVTCTVKPDVVYMTMCHHPPQWLRDAPQLKTILNERVSIQLYGHVHADHLQVSDARSLTVQAGAVQPEIGNNPFEPRYNVLELQLISQSESFKLKVRVWSRTWNIHHSRFVADFRDGETPYREYILDLQNVRKGTTNQEPGLTEPVSTVRVEAGEEITIADVDAKGMMVGPHRTLQHRLYKLQFQDLMEVAVTLDLLAEDDKNAAVRDLTSKVFVRAYEQIKLQELWELVNQKLDLTEENPFVSEINR